jgi:iron(III) transport system permease protein
MEASAVCGASEGRTFLKVVLPLMLPGLIAGWALVFVLMSGEVTASSLLAGIGRPVVGFVILDVWEAGTFGNLAALAGTFAVLNIFVVLIALRLGRRNYQKA